MDRVSTILPTVLRKRGFSGAAYVSRALEESRLWIAHRLPNQMQSLRPGTVDRGILIIEATNVFAHDACDALAAELQVFLLNTFPGAHIDHVRVVRTS